MSLKSKVGFIYVIENLLNGKLYVGQTANPSERKRYHFSRFSHCRALSSAIKKYSKENFQFSLLEKCFSQSELDARESFWIRTLGTLAPGGYNLTTGGEVALLSEETKQKISASRVGERNPMYGRTGEDSPSFGRKHTLEALAKMSKVHLGKVIPPETRQKMSQAHQGQHRATENPFYGKTHSAESRNRMSKAGRGRKKSIEHREKLRQAALLRWQKRKAN